MKGNPIFSRLVLSNIYPFIVFWFVILKKLTNFILGTQRVNNIDQVRCWPVGPVDAHTSESEMTIFQMTAFSVAPWSSGRNFLPSVVLIHC
jgi:hypothetical protein